MPAASAMEVVIVIVAVVDAIEEVQVDPTTPDLKKRERELYLLKNKGIWLSVTEVHETVEVTIGQHNVVRSQL